MIVRTVLLSSALCGLVPAQDQATTLVRLARGADLVVQARALRATDPDPTRHRWEFATEVPVRGRAAAHFSLEEPSGRCCGRALHGVTAGASYLLFLEDVGGSLHLLGGARGMEPADAGLLRHVRALSTTTPVARVELLADALESPHPRVRRDAALALPWESALPTAGAASRQRIVRAAPRLLEAGDTALSGVLVAAARLGEADVALALLPGYLAGTGEDLDGLLLAHLPALDPSGICRALAERLPADPNGRLRAVRLLDRVADPAARAPLLRLVQQGEPDCREHAAAALLRLGVAREVLRPWVSAAALDGAELRARRPAFRVVRPGGGR